MLGQIQESLQTKHFHSLGTPVLVSSLILRSKGLGQIDVAYIQKTFHWKLKIIEIKTKTVPSRKQWLRLLGAQDFLGKVLEMESKLEVKFCQKDQDSLFF